jgi:urease accessory protein
MDIIEKVLGNAEDSIWAPRLAASDVDVLELSQWDAQKNRLRGETAQGRSLAIALERGHTLRDGDILLWDEAGRSAVVCRMRLCPVMAVDMSGLRRLPAGEALASAVRLGHALGNQHWPAVVKEDAVYVPVTVGRDVVSAVMGTHAVPGTSYAFIPGEDVERMLDPEEARRLFGGAEAPLDGAHHHHWARHEAGAHTQGSPCPERSGADSGASPHGKHHEGYRHGRRYGGQTGCPGHASQEEADGCPICRRHAQA